MKIRNDKFKNTSDFEGRKGSATLNMEKLSLFMDSMISNYNYPELAVLREWVSNAHDAHVAAGMKRPVKVTLPSALNPTLTVQDFGLGMTSDFVENFYLSFGSSSKDKSNDEIGGFGQGGKSALAIAAQYTMTTISEGLKNIYIFERSPLGGVDFKLVVEEVPTDEPSGTVVQVAVDNWSQYSEVNLNRVLAGWSNADIELNTGKQFFSIPDNGTAVSYEVDFTDYNKASEEGFEEDIRSEKGYVLHGAFDINGASKKLSSELGLGWNEYVVLVGPVAYVFAPEVNDSAVLSDYMAVSVNIGDVSFPSSREVIEPTRVNRKTVGACFEKLVAEADKLLQERADGVKDRAAALALHRSPLVKNRRNFVISFKGEEVPLRFTPKADDALFSYQHIGNWRGVKNFKFSEEAFSADSEFNLNVETLVILDDDSSSVSIRNNARARHNSLDHSPKELNGFLLITKNPDKWVKAAAKAVVKSSELAQIAKDYRKKERDAKAAAAAAGTAPAIPVKKTRKERIGEYDAAWLNFGTNKEGVLKIEGIRSDLMEFFENEFDPKKTLVLSTNQSEYNPLDFVTHFENFSVNPKDVQFLNVYTGSKIETLRLLLGEDVKIMGLGEWVQENFAKLAQYKGRSPQEIADELPLTLGSYAMNLLVALGVGTLHSKYAEFIEAQKELDAAKAMVTGNYYTEASRLIRSVMSDFGNVKAKIRPEFFFLDHLNYYRGYDMPAEQKAAIRQTLNQMVETWLDNLALEEAEAEDTVEKAAKGEATEPLLATSATN